MRSKRFSLIFTLVFGLFLGTFSASAQSPYQSAAEELAKRLPKVYCPANLIILPKFELKVLVNGNELTFEKYLYTAKGDVESLFIQKFKCEDITAISVDKNALQDKYGNVIISIATTKDAVRSGYSRDKMNSTASVFNLDICRTVPLTQVNELMALFNNLKGCPAK